MSAPSSHWASVYTSDNTHYTQPVRDAVYPLPEGVSRSDWFNSYPYQKFEDKSTEEDDDEVGLFENVANAVGDVRKKLTDIGDDVVNKALGLVGAGKKVDRNPEKHDHHQRQQQQEYQQYQQQYQQQPEQQQQQYQNYEADNRVTEELVADSNNVQSSFVKPETVSPVS